MRRVVVGVLALVLSSGPRASEAKPRETSSLSALSASEQEALRCGDVVRRPLRFARGVEGHYVGGVSYQVVRATPAEVMASLIDVAALPQILPKTKRATLLEGGGMRATVELVQGGSLFEAKYTVQLERSQAGDEIRFWMDRSRPHDVRDVWGYFRVRPFDREHTLVTVGAVLDLGPGIVRALFEDAIQNIILGSPRSIKNYVEPRAFAAAP